MVLSGATLALGTQQAQAANDSFATTCVPPKIANLPNIHGTTIASLSSSNASPKVGDTVTITWKTVKAASNNPNIIDLPANVVLPTGTIKVGGAQSGSLPAKGTRTNPATPKNSPMLLSDMTATVTLTTAGSVTFTPGAYNINVNVGLSTDTSCTPDATPPVGLTLTVGAGSGSTGSTTSGTTGSTTSGTTGSTTSGTTGSTTSGTSGSTTSGSTGSTGSTTSGSTGSSTGTGGTSGSSSSGGLAATGGDNSSIQALGLAGGTALLVGAAVFALTPWRRLRRPR
jgi:hypothetical protein